MASLAGDQSWLLKPSIIKQVQQCRRLIQVEFGIKLHLTQENLINQLEHFASQSRSAALPRIWSALKDSVPGLNDEIKLAREGAARTYRGQPVSHEASATTDPASSPRTIIYRGRVVTR